MSLHQLFKTQLPNNRKERFYTGTVFPMIVAKDNLKHLDTLYSLLGDPKIGEGITGDPSECIEFFTEYSLVESLPGTRRTFKGLPKTKDTPDIVILVMAIKKTLIALEAKMYDNPSIEKLNEQLDNQSLILKAIENQLGVDKTIHAALIPEKLSRKAGKLKYQTVTWESLLDVYEDICDSDYFYLLLKESLNDYDNLVSSDSSASYGKNNQGYAQGHLIYSRFKAGDRTIKFVGRNKGLNGDVLANDIVTGGWRNQSYETRTSGDSPPNRNWFTVEEFVDTIESGIDQ